jgi:beta-carotene/zeaxanthin 4-ketolase
MGLFIGVAIVLSWLMHLTFCLMNDALTWQTPKSAFHILLQGYLSTGLFITAHDAMHGSVSKRRWLNHSLGYVSSFLFAGLSYQRLRAGHVAHHKHPVSETDPDFNASQNFWIWFGSFIWRYKTWSQLAVMAALYNLFQHAGHIPEARIWMFWMIPSLLGSLQLFYFGTYLPHRLPHDDLSNPHQARSQRKNHFRAMLSCYFFGYHWEHHHSPATPWWKLWELKDQNLQAAPKLEKQIIFSESHSPK